MEGEHEIVDGDQVIVEEIVDEGEVYDESQVYGEEELYLDASTLDVDNLPPGEYFQLPDGQLIPASEAQSMPSSSHQSERTVQQMRPQHIGMRRPLQNENSSMPSMNQVYAIRGNQVIRVDKGNQRTSNLKGAEMKVLPKAEVDDLPIPSSSANTYGGTNVNRASFHPSFRKESNFGMGLSAAIPKPKKKIITGHRKPCNCTKSMCLKLYCECFANGEFCRDCNCKDCHNNLAHESERTRAIKSSLERNPNAFKPKIAVTGSTVKGKAEASERLHMKGCHCKKSNCLKNYCECYETDRASKFRDRMGPAALLSLANVASISENRPGTPFSEDESDAEGEEKTDPKTMPWFYLTDEVVEASTLCLVAQAEQMERDNEDVTEDHMERVLMAEFSNCLQSIIQSATDSAAAAKITKANNRLQRAAAPCTPPEIETTTTSVFDDA
ncbi:lin-54 [Pristionchus pacificus]|uniref:Lin-54 n=1 Tax=Pristionchus pacificus TaxID=54126 RepID=A0A2A6CB58_PRIPA|nr:lin-54 [Pristionchus pacificus]|eukprot:PDM75369.1 lin-54 [Pristionchus pacificus]